MKKFDLDSWIASRWREMKRRFEKEQNASGLNAIAANEAGMREGFNKARSVLLAESRWIPASESLPESEDTVVCHCIDKNYGNAEYCIYLDHLILTGKYTKNYGWLVYGPKDWFGVVEVTYWMPLPAPPTNKMQGEK